jgi:hypothetical protein
MELTWPLFALLAEIILIAWIMTATIRGLKKVCPIQGIRETGLMKAIWKLESALGLSLIGLAGFGIVLTYLYPYTLGIGILVVTLGVFILIHEATRDLEKVPVIAGYIKKIEAWAKKKR